MVANKLMRGDTVLPVAHHRSEADVVEEVCGRTDPIHQMSVINSHSHHRQISLHERARKQRAGALMSDAPIILPGWERHTGGSRLTPTVHPCPFRRGRLWVARHSNTAPNKNEPKL